LVILSPLKLWGWWKQIFHLYKRRMG